MLPRRRLARSQMRSNASGQVEASEASIVSRIGLGIALIQLSNISSSHGFHIPPASVERWRTLNRNVRLLPAGYSIEISTFTLRPALRCDAHCLSSVDIPSGKGVTPHHRHTFALAAGCEMELARPIASRLAIHGRVIGVSSRRPWPAPPAPAPSSHFMPATRLSVRCLIAHTFPVLKVTRQSGSFHCPMTDCRAIWLAISGLHVQTQTRMKPSLIRRT